MSETIRPLRMKETAAAPEYAAIAVDAVVPRRPSWQPRLGAVLFASSLLTVAAVPWWHTIGTGEPTVVQFGRGCLALAAVILLVGAIIGSHLRHLATHASLAAILLPPFILAAIVLDDAPSIREAVNQTDQVRRVLNFLSKSDFVPETPYLVYRPLRAVGVVTNDFTFIDGMDSASTFVRPPMILSAFLGFFGIFAILAMRRSVPKRTLKQYAFAIPIVILGLTIRPTVGGIYWSLARNDTSQSRYVQAIEHYRTAASWDPRLDADMTYHFELGRVYSQIGRKDAPDYFLTVATMQVLSNQAYTRYRPMVRAIDTFLANVRGVDASPALRMATVQMLQKTGTLEYQGGDYSSAANHLRQALQLDPNNLETLFDLASVLMRMEEYRPSSRVWQRIIRLNEGVGTSSSRYSAALQYRKPLTARAWSGLAWCSYQSGLTDLAQKCQANATQLGSPAIIEIPLSNGGNS